MALSEELPKQWRKSPTAKCSLLTLVLTKKVNNKDKKYHDISIPFKSQVHSKHGSPTFIIFGL